LEAGEFIGSISLPLPSENVYMHCHLLYVHLMCCIVTKGVFTSRKVGEKLL
jgi:hypothetical protein